MSEPLHLQPDPEPETEQVRLGDQTVNLDPETARVIREQFEALGAQYGAALENFQRQALQQVGTPWVQQPQYQYQPQPVPDLVPDVDGMFQNKGAWTNEFQQGLEQRFLAQNQHQTALVQGALNAMQQEFARRDAAQTARTRHDAVMQEMLERRGLTENTLVVQAVYDREYEKLKHLPLEMAIDRIGAEASDEIERIRSGEEWQLAPAKTQTGVAPRPPAMLRSARRAPRAAAPAASGPPEGTLQSPAGELGAMGRIIRQRQAQIMARSGAA